MRNFWYATAGIVLLVGLVVAGSCSTTNVAEAGTNDGGASSQGQSIPASELPLVASVRQPTRDVPVEEVDCSFEAAQSGAAEGMTGADAHVQSASVLEATRKCRDSLRRQARESGADYVVLTTQQSHCISSYCNVVFVGTAYESNAKGE